VCIPIRPIDGHHSSRILLYLILRIFVTSLLASDDESDAEIVDVTSQEVVDSTSSAPKGDKRPRSRSRSLTPPPELSTHQIQNVRNVVR